MICNYSATVFCVLNVTTGHQHDKGNVAKYSGLGLFCSLTNLSMTQFVHYFVEGVMR